MKNLSNQDLQLECEYTFVANLQYMAHGSLSFEQNLVGTQQVFDIQTYLLAYEL